VELVLEIDLAQDVVARSCFASSAQLVGDGRPERDVALDRMMGEEVEALEDDADVPPQLAQRAPAGGSGAPSNDDAAAVDALEPVDAAQERRLARARASDDATTSPVSTSSETSSSTGWSRSA
jgi:hypothetical protein